MVEADLELYRTTKEEYLLEAGEEERGCLLRELESETARRHDLERGHRARAVVDGRNGDGRRPGVLVPILSPLGSNSMNYPSKLSFVFSLCLCSLSLAASDALQARTTLPEWSCQAGPDCRGRLAEGL